MGGWKIMPGSCSKGFRSRPSAAAGTSRSKGLDVSSVNSRKPTSVRPITERMRASTGSGRRLLKIATAPIQPHCISSHSSIDPSCPPHTAAMRNSSGSALLALDAT